MNYLLGCFKPFYNFLDPEILLHFESPFLSTCTNIMDPQKDTWASFTDCARGSVAPNAYLWNALSWKPELEWYDLSFYETISKLHKDQLNLYMEKEKLKRAGELDSLRGRQNQLQAQVEMCKEKITAVEAREQELLEQNQRLQNDLGMEQEEVKRLQLLLTSQGTQYGHDLKKKEQELGKLKEKVHQLLAERREKRASIDILNTLNRMDGKRATWTRAGKPDNKKEGELFRTMVANLEHQVADITQENKELKRFLGQLDKDMVKLLSLPQNNPSDDDGEEVVSVDNGDIILEHWNSLKKEVERLKEHAPEECLCRDRMSIITDQDKELAQLREEIQQSRDLIVWQQQCFQEQLNQAEELPQDIQGSYLLEEQFQLQEAKTLFTQQQANFELERHRFTEAAIRLGHERRCFEQERAMFLKERLLQQESSLSLGSPQFCPDLSLPQTPEQELCPKSPGITPLSMSSKKLDRNPPGKEGFQDPPAYRLLKKHPVDSTGIFYRNDGHKFHILDHFLDDFLQ
ncbi:afadin- and alpha-actinin-binding protein-like isoform X7 [Monodelphis domestica]|uniref:afadin- and alpha-actinin-binding protein-like isoform X7 n=1 Tax=Monodelphis domestica TaxID=13616 RepID=UPI0024E1D99D|nr:afadin- and alpha-actinin-binding protein-like isoform X7 [Monodelphis domestica]